MIEDSYETAFRQRMDGYHKELWAHLDLLPSLDPTRAREALFYLLELACRAQNTRNIELGRTALLAVPREWLVAHIEAVTEPLVDLNDEWEHRRLLELYQRLDAGLVRRLAERGLLSSNLEIREASREFLEKQSH